MRLPWVFVEPAKPDKGWFPAEKAWNYFTLRTDGS